MNQGGLRKKEGVTLPEEVVNQTRKKYEEARDLLMGTGRLRTGVHGKKGLKGGNELMLQTDQAADAIRSVAGEASSTIHGKKGLLADETGLQTDQVADANEDEARKGSSTVHGKRGLVTDETGLQTDQVADAIKE